MNNEKQRELLKDVVTLNVEHQFSAEEQVENANLLAKYVQDKVAEEAKKKQTMGEFKARIDQLGSNVNLYSGYVANGFCYRDKPCELWLNFETKKREYILKETNEVVKTEPFRESDYQKQLNLEATDEEVQFRNDLGGYADAVLKPVPKNNLGDNYGADQEFEDDGLFDEDSED